jgi:hypothetical protein
VDVDAALLIGALVLLLIGLGGVPIRVPRGTAERQRRLWDRYLDELQRWK